MVGPAVRRVAAVLCGLLALTIAPVPSAAASPKRSCHGIGYHQVRGHPLGYGRHALRRYPVRRLTCRAYFLPAANAHFVPQALALDGHTAWVSGYTAVRRVSEQACRLVRIDLSTGRVLANQGRITGRTGRSRPTFCRHGGGLALDGHGLWLSEKDRLWLLIPSRVGRVPHWVTRRVWRIHRPVYGSTVVVHANQVGLASYRSGHRGSLAWFSTRSLLRRGVTDLVGGHHRRRHQAVPRSVASTTASLQGVTWRGRGSGSGLVTTRSWPGCGQAVLANGRRFGVLPGIQDVQFAGSGRMWVVSEASARPFQRPGSAVVPMLSELSAGAIRLRGSGRC